MRHRLGSALIFAAAAAFTALPLQAQAFDHSAFDRLLAEHVRDDRPIAICDALELARRARSAADPIKVAAPHTLWAAARGDFDAGDIGFHDIGEHYRHAMKEAGHLVDRATGKPFDICPDCGHSFASAQPDVLDG